MADPGIKIIVAIHKPTLVPDSHILLPVQVGAALSKERLPGAESDNTGDNISRLNRSYNELTALYWAWKNLNSDYIGLFHYRRYLDFADPPGKAPNKAYITIQDGLDHIDISDETIRKTIEKYDVILPRISSVGARSIYDQYAREHYIKDLDDCLAYISQKYPKIAKFFHVVHQKQGYFYNISIMKREIFNGYCQFLFDVLGDFDQHHDISAYSPYQHRANGFLAERLTNIYIHYLMSLKKYKFKELPVAYFENTAPSPTLKPIAKSNNIAIVLAANNQYMPYVSTLLHSIAASSVKNNTYDINIFHSDITEARQKTIIDEFSSKANFHIRFVNMTTFIAKFTGLTQNVHIAHITVETYFRIFIPDIMGDYKKVLYLDSDLIVNCDIAELYNTDIKDHLLAAVRDFDMAGAYNSNSVEAENTIDPKRKSYIDNTLKIKKPYGYFQAGVILFNIELMQENLKSDDIIEYAASHQLQYLDQDALNYFAQGNVEYLDPSWNVLYDHDHTRIKDVISKAPIYLYEEYMHSRLSPKIIHYGGAIKPWHDPGADMANRFWYFARQSAFYEVILSHMAVYANQKDHRKKLTITKKSIDKTKKILNKHFPHGTKTRARIHNVKIAIKKIIHI